MISSIRYKSWLQLWPSLTQGYSLQMTAWFHITLLTHIWRLCFSKSTGSSTVAGKKGSSANTKSFWKPYCDCPSLVHQDFTHTSLWVSQIRFGGPLWNSSSTPSFLAQGLRGSLVTVLGTVCQERHKTVEKDPDKGRKAEIWERLGNLSLFIWKKRLRSSTSVFKHIKGSKKGKRINCTPEWFKQYSKINFPVAKITEVLNIVLGKAAELLYWRCSRVDCTCILQGLTQMKLIPACVKEKSFGVFWHLFK